MRVSTILPVVMTAAMVQALNITSNGTSTTSSTMTLAQVLAANNKTLSTLSSLLMSNPTLLATLEKTPSLTILAPSNDAFSKLLATSGGKAAAADPTTLTALLSYHVLNGTFPASAFTTSSQFLPTLLTDKKFANVTGGQVVGGLLSGKSVLVYSGLKERSTVTTADVMYNMGVVHVIDTVLTIPLPPSGSAVDSDLTALAGALTTTSLVTAVDNLSDVTIFAPSNAAFEKIASVATSVDKATLSKVLEYHVINGTVGYSSLLSTGLANETLPSLVGTGLNILAENGKVFVNSAQVTIADIIVANGVMHVVDNVLNPSNTTATPNPTATTQPVAFAGATSAASVPFTSGISATTTAPSASTKTAAANKVEFGNMKMAALFGAVGLMGNL